MRPHAIYILIGLSTLALNLVLILHKLGRYKAVKQKEVRNCGDVISFKLTKGEYADSKTTAAVPYDDTIPL